MQASKYRIYRLHTCPGCHKTFIIPMALHGSWIFKGQRNGRLEYFCSYGCYKRRRNLHTRQEEEK